ncbi:hypothetical protein [Paenibacillus donghaensis]|uniref:hypothetical protein n=1 Tax=Paenibacillus donghaensis TaxID=414771 RepID=UPI0012FAF2C0|nr:hypothetical protein [Paenibacillus donghaensis]
MGDVSISAASFAELGGNHANCISYIYFGSKSSQNNFSCIWCSYFSEKCSSTPKWGIINVRNTVIPQSAAKFAVINVRNTVKIKTAKVTCHHPHLSAPNNHLLPTTNLHFLPSTWLAEELPH